jgi:hypothetical protein
VERWRVRKLRSGVMLSVLLLSASVDESMSSRMKMKSVIIVNKLSFVMHPSSQPAEAVIKRGRGRPPSKNHASITAKQHAVPKPRGRGRPPKPVSAQIKKTSSGSGLRGRPRVYPVNYDKVQKLALLLTPAEKKRLGELLLAQKQ